MLLRCTDHSAEISAAKQRAVLALLIARRNTVVRLERIIEELWPGRAPRSATANVRTYVSALRRSLGSDRDRLTTITESYLLRVADDELDVVRFEREAARGRIALREGAVDEAVFRYREALRLWRGEPLQDVPAGPTLQPYVTALAAARVDARECLLEAELLAGEVDAAVGLRRFLVEHPARESAWCMLIRALYASGDRVGALEAYQQARHGLVTTLGLEPGPELEAVHREVLNGTPHATRLRSRRTRGAVMTPRQLPLAPAVLVGRDVELELLRKELAEEGRPDPAAQHGPRIVALYGMGGVGKSSLAVAAAHHVAADYPDGQLYIDLRGSSPGVRPLEPAEAVGRFLRALGVSEEHISPDASEAAAWFRSTTAGRRVLVVLDNAVDVEQMRPLLPSGPGCSVLVTSRRALTTLDGALRVGLGELSREAAIELLRRLAGRERTERHPEAAEEIAELCGRLPLAVRVAGFRLARNPEWDLPEAARRLRRARSRLDELGLDDLDVRSTFEVGYQALVDDRGRGRHRMAAARLFRRLSVVEFAEFTPTAAAALIDVEEHDVQRCLDTLVDHGLIEHFGSTYRLHDLLRLFAMELATREESPTDIAAAVRRTARQYIRIIMSSAALRRRQDDDPPSHAVVDPSGPRTMAEAMEWFSRHLPALTALTRQLAADPDTTLLAYDLVRPLHRSLGSRQPAECIRLYEPVLAAAERDEHRNLAAQVLCTLANCQMFLGRNVEAAALMRRARRALSEIDDDRLRARILGVSADASLRSGDCGPALRFAVDAVELYGAHERWFAMGLCLDIAARAAILIGRADESLSYHVRCVPLMRRYGGREDIGGILDNVAVVYYRMNRMRAALRCADWAVRIAEENGGAGLLWALQTRSLTRHALGDEEGAIADAERAVDAARERGGKLELDTLRNLGVVLWLSGDPRAAAVLRQADTLNASPD